MINFESPEIPTYSDILENLFLKKGLRDCEGKCFLMFTCDFGTVTISRHPLDKIQTKTSEILFGYAIVVRSPETGKIIKSYSIKTEFDLEEGALKEVTSTNEKSTSFKLDQILNAHAPNSQITTDETVIDNFVVAVASKQSMKKEASDPSSISPGRQLCEVFRSFREEVIQTVRAA